MTLLISSVLPVVIFLYMNYRKDHEKEPISQQLSFQNIASAISLQKNQRNAKSTNKNTVLILHDFHL